MADDETRGRCGLPLLAQLTVIALAFIAGAALACALLI